MKEDSHIFKHWAKSHQDMAAPSNFKMKLISSLQDALTRQISKSVRIDTRGVGGYSRCHLPRLVIDNEEWKMAKKDEKKELEKEKDESITGLESVKSQRAGNRYGNQQDG